LEAKHHAGNLNDVGDNIVTGFKCSVGFSTAAAYQTALIDVEIAWGFVRCKQRALRKLQSSLYLLIASPSPGVS
jgi:hypothetical protein